VKHLCKQNLDNPVSGITRSGWHSGLQFLVKYLIKSVAKSPKAAYNLLLSTIHSSIFARFAVLKNMKIECGAS